MTHDEIRALFRRRNEALANKDALTVSLCHTDDCVIESPMFGTVVGRKMIQEVTHRWFAAFPDIQFDWDDDLLITGDRVVQTSIGHGTDTGGWLGLPPTGRPFRLFFTFLCVLRDGLIAQERRVYDVTGLLQQLATDVAHGAETKHVYRVMFERARMEHELKIAADIQRALLPALCREGNGFDIAGASLPCRAIGGDFISYFDLSSEAFGFVIGDVAGKGPPAALLAAELQGIVAALSYSSAGLSDTVSRVNQILVRQAVEGRFATAMFGVISIDGRLTYCNAGHNPPILVSSGSVHRLDIGGRILGAFAETSFDMETILLEPGDVLVMFTDGVTEALSADEEEFGDERLLSFAQANSALTPTAFVEELLGNIRTFCQGVAQSDDVTALVLRYRGN
jgi:serine phosphatase RsbU (regulator of sigma subunit)/predicted ester cyclase